MENRFQLRLDDLLDHGLRNPIRHGRDAKLSRTALLLRNFHLLHRRREIRARRHPVPQLVEIPRPVLLENCDGFIVNACSTPVGLDLLVCLPNRAFRNYIRLCRVLAAPPRFRVGSFARLDNAVPSLPARYERFIATMNSSAPRSGVGILPHGASHLSFPLSSEARFSRSAPKPVPGSCRLYTDCRRASKQVPSRLIRELLGGSSFDSSLNP